MRNKILLAHGDGGVLTNKLISETILKYIDNEISTKLYDSAYIELSSNKICFTTDSFVVTPIFFPGGDIGSLSVYGTVNDLAVSGATPLYLTLSFIIEEGLEIKIFEKILQSVKEASKKASVKIVAGDTKVVPKGHCDKIFINTSGIGVYNYSKNISPESISKEDLIIVNKSIGEHGLAVLLARENFGIDSTIVSDSMPLNIEIEKLKNSLKEIHCMRDATRGGVATILLELANQSKKNFEIFETEIPIKDEVKGICEILGFDPLYIANEGVYILIIPEKEKNIALTLMPEAKIIGRVKESGEGRVFLKTKIGGFRELDIYSGSLIPRIC